VPIGNPGIVFHIPADYLDMPRYHDGRANLLISLLPNLEGRTPDNDAEFRHTGITRRILILMSSPEEGPWDLAFVATQYEQNNSYHPLKSMGSYADLEMFKQIPPPGAIDRGAKDIYRSFSKLRPPVSIRERSYHPQL
jgi:hypothetical protein